MPCLELFERQPQDYRDSVLPRDPAASPDIDALLDAARQRGHAPAAIEPGTRRLGALAMQGTTLRRAHRPGRFDGSAMLFIATQEGQAGYAAARWRRTSQAPSRPGRLAAAMRRSSNPRSSGTSHGIWSGR